MAEMNNIFLETDRLILRRITHDDFAELCRMLQDIEVMYAWEYAFTDEQVRQWIDRRIAQYAEYGYSHFLAVERSGGRVVGQIGMVNEPIDGKDYLGIGWILAKDEWGKGYATEGARACIDYAFETLGASEIIADIRPCNTASRKVAERLRMSVIGEFTKSVNGKDMPHLIYHLDKKTHLGRR